MLTDTVEFWIALGYAFWFLVFAAAIIGGAIAVAEISERIGRK